MRQAYRNPDWKAKPRLAWLVWMLVLLAGCSQASSEFERGLLWKIEKDGARPSFLFGTVHLDDPRVLNLPSVVKESLDGAKTFVMEIEIDALTSLQSMSAMTFSDGKRLPDVIPAELYRRVRKATEERGLPVAMIDQMKPWAIATVLSVPEPRTGEFLDLSLLRRAQKMGKHIKALETIEEQLSMLGGFSLQEQILMLEDTLNHLDQLPAMHDQMLTAYLQRDLDRLSQISERAMGLGSSDQLARKFWDALIGQRNKRMTERMLPMLSEGSVFIAVGALHLPGDNGLLQELSDRGYEVRAVY